MTQIEVQICMGYWAWPYKRYEAQPTTSQPTYQTNEPANQLYPAVSLPWKNKKLAIFAYTAVIYKNPFLVHFEHREICLLNF